MSKTSNTDTTKDKIKDSKFRITDRDYKIVQEIDRWQICTSRHIRYLAGFTGQRACDRRLRKLIDAGYIERKKILYGFPGIYQNTYKAKALGHVPKEKKIRVEHLSHDISVLDTAIYMNKRGIPFTAMTTERQLHSTDGFSVRKHRPDFAYTQDRKTTCVEVELTLKARTNFVKNIKDDFTNYDKQIWVVPDLDCKIACILQENIKKYPNIEILELSEVKDNR